jgi:putative ABC transport system ATP-binding protein
MTSIRLTAVAKMRGAGVRAQEVLRDISMSVSGGELVLLLGPSGSGKTTLLAVIAGLLSADRGDVEVAGKRMSGASQAERRAARSTCIGFVFQRPHLIAALTARENVRLMAALAGAGSREAARDADVVLDIFGIGHLANRLPHELSGGEEQRVAIARALVHRPAVLLVDEPTANLDAAAGAGVAAQLVCAAKEYGSAVVVATHDLRLTACAARTLTMRDGCLHS